MKEEGKIRVRIDSRDISRHQRKEMPPGTRVHKPKNAFRRSRFNWQDAIEEIDGDEFEGEWSSSSSSSSSSHV